MFLPNSTSMFSEDLSNRRCQMICPRKFSRIQTAICDLELRSEPTPRTVVFLRTQKRLSQSGNFPTKTLWCSSQSSTDGQVCRSSVLLRVYGHYLLMNSIRDIYKLFHDIFGKCKYVVVMLKLSIPDYSWLILRNYWCRKSLLKSI